MLASCSAAALVCSLLVTVAARRLESEDYLEAFKEKFVRDLGLERIPDMREVHTSRHHMQRMTRKYLRRVSRGELTTHRPKVCTEDSVIFQPDGVDHPSDVRWARLRLLNASASTSVPSDAWSWTPTSSATLVVPCAGAHCCDVARLQLVERPPRNSRGRRSPSSSSSSCGRKPLRVNFKELGWDWVVQPLEFEAFFCSGRCRGGAAEEFASTHALVQSILSAKKGGHVGRPCCAPRKLRPLDLLHYNDKTPPELVVTRQKGMIVRQCACA